MQGAPFKFDQNNEMHRRAQHYLETMDREKFPTFGDVMVAAIVDYFDRYYAGDQEDAGGDSVYVDAKATDQAFNAGVDDLAQSDLEAVVERAVEKALERKLPEVIGPLLEKCGQGSGEEQNSADLESVEKDINWGFLGG